MAWGDSWSSGQQEKKYADIPQGEYEAVLTKAGLDKSKSPSVVNLEYTLTGMDMAGKSFANRKVWQNYKEDKGEEFLMNDLRSMGNTEKITAQNIETILHSMVGKEVMIFIKPRIWEGKTYYSAYCNGVLQKAEVMKGAPASTAGLKNHAPGIDTTEEIPF